MIIVQFVFQIDATNDRHYSFNEFRKYVIKLASALHKRGVAKNDVLAMLLPNCVEGVVSAVAVPAIGAILTCSNPINTPGKSLQYIL